MQARTRRELEAQTKTRVCAACSGALTVATNPAAGQLEYVLRCPRCGVVDPKTRNKREDGPEERFTAHGLDGLRDAIELMQLTRRIQKRIAAAESNGRTPAARDVSLLRQLETAAGSG